MLNVPHRLPFQLADSRFTELDGSVCIYIPSDEMITHLKKELTSSGFKLLELTRSFGIPSLPSRVPLVALSFGSFEWPLHLLSSCYLGLETAEQAQLLESSEYPQMGRPLGSPWCWGCYNPGLLCLHNHLLPDPTAFAFLFWSI